MNPKSATSGTVQSVERVFELLELITDAGGSITLSELSQSTSLPLPTIHRLLRTLVSLGYARQLPNRMYSLGPKLIRIGDGANKQLGTAAQPQLKNLVTLLGETANMAILDGDRVVYIAQAPSQHSMRMFTEVGRRASLHNTGVGKALLAKLDDEKVRGIVSRTGMEKLTERGLGTPEELIGDLNKIRERGYSIDDEEQELGVRCFAIAIPNAPTPTAISVSGPVTRVDDAFAKRAIPLLRSASEAIGADLKAN